MKKKPLFLVAFLLMLYIAPVVFISSHGHTAILTQPNTSKEFSLSEYGDESPQSITNFSETLSDDVLFYPDAFVNDTPHVADSGEDDYADSQVLDAVTWSADDTREYANFDCEDNCQIEKVSYSCYAYGYDGDGYLEVWNGSDWTLLETIAETVEVYSWYNGTFYDSTYILSGNVIRLGIYGDQMWHYAAVDYLEITIEYMTLADSAHYAESFADVSEWSWISGEKEADDSFSTDGDILSLEVFGDADDEYDGIEVTGLSIPIESYIEINWHWNTTTNVDSVRIYLYSGAAYVRWDILIGSGDWVILKYHVPSGYESGTLGSTIDKIWLRPRIDSGCKLKVDIDYLRISPSNETGWGHDGSTTAGVSNEGSEGCATVLSSDGDILTFETEKTSGTDTHYYNEFESDTTTTHAELEYDYYPFFKLRYRITESNNAQLKMYINFDDALVINQEHSENETTGWITLICNLDAGSADNVDYNLRFYQVVSDAGDIGNLTFEVDFAKAYSIANFTYEAGGGESTNDYSYVENGNLIVHTDTYTKWNHDPTLSVAIDPFCKWSASVASGADYFRFRELLDTNTIWDQGVTSGELVGTTLTDFDILIYGNCEIEAIKFIDNYKWHIVENPIIWFEVPVFTGSLDALLIILGLIMIPASTLYLVKGGKDEMSSDKVFYFLIVFVIGWGLFLGGIYG